MQKWKDVSSIKSPIKDSSMSDLSIPSSILLSISSISLCCSGLGFLNISE